ncbi:protein translocase subunit SecF [Bacillus horti]|uniref:Protein-export membrane protein SecF n=1 Tax=Caldalkalibacillus horti TaxID=77523 RepID=A0ABT9VTC7_9BACI|nr:protein translocase subunit SecF [Bacillus horti]MDQ0164243.1 preprotein translocase SecF subunit [Bacillus horti]
MNFKDKLHLDFVKHRNKYFLISGVLILLGVIFLAIFGLNLSVDFEGGTRVEIMIEDVPFTADDINEVFADIGFSPGEIRISGNESETAAALFPGVLTQEEMDLINATFMSVYGDDIAISEITVSAGIARELARSAIYSVLLALVGMGIYIAFRFEYKFAVSAIVALIQVGLVVVSVFSIIRMQVDLTFIAAVLTVIGYSINDTIVIFDRIRENLKTAKIKNEDDLAQLVNKSITDTLTRSINTFLTIIFAVVALYFFGSESIRPFSFAMLIGLIAGAFSSLFIAAQLWYVWKSKEIRKASTTSTTN